MTRKERIAFHLEAAESNLQNATDYAKAVARFEAESSKARAILEECLECADLETAEEYSRRAEEYSAIAANYALAMVATKQKACEHMEKVKVLQK